MRFMMMLMNVRRLEVKRAEERSFPGRFIPLDFWTREEIHLIGDAAHIVVPDLEKTKPGDDCGFIEEPYVVVPLRILEEVMGDLFPRDWKPAGPKALPSQKLPQPPERPALTGTIQVQGEIVDDEESWDYEQEERA